MSVIGRCALSLILALAVTPASAEVIVSFNAPERYTDAGHRVADRDAVARALTRHLQRLGERHLAADQVLRIEVLDIDLAGRFEPWRPHAQDVRFLREVTWPRITLRYTLETGGHPAQAVEEKVIDQNYLTRIGVGRDSDSLYYEKQMLEDWFRARFASH